jgi:hypothetical protein
MIVIRLMVLLLSIIFWFPKSLIIYFNTKNKFDLGFFWIMFCSVLQLNAIYFQKDANYLLNSLNGESDVKSLIHWINENEFDKPHNI